MSGKRRPYTTPRKLAVDWEIVRHVQKTRSKDTTIISFGSSTDDKGRVESWTYTQGEMLQEITDETAIAVEAALLNGDAKFFAQLALEMRREKAFNEKGEDSALLALAAAAERGPVNVYALAKQLTAKRSTLFPAIYKRLGRYAKAWEVKTIRR